MIKYINNIFEVFWTSENKSHGASRLRTSVRNLRNSCLHFACSRLSPVGQRSCNFSEEQKCKKLRVKSFTSSRCFVCNFLIDTWSLRDSSKMFTRNRDEWRAAEGEVVRLELHDRCLEHFCISAKIYKRKGSAVARNCVNKTKERTRHSFFERVYQTQRKRLTVSIQNNKFEVYASYRQKFHQPYWIHFEFWILGFRFKFSDPGNL